MKINIKKYSLDVSSSVFIAKETLNVPLFVVNRNKIECNFSIIFYVFFLFFYVLNELLMLRNQKFLQYNILDFRFIEHQSSAIVCELIHFDRETDC